MSTPARVAPRAVDDRLLADWTLPEGPVPESVLHADVVTLLAAILAHWVDRKKLDALVARNLAVRFHEADPRVGVDPDLALVVPRPPDAATLASLCTWLPGHRAPLLGVEVVSRSHPYEDHDATPEKYAAAGIGELWVFDPLLAGPRSLGGPLRLQIWTRAADGELVRAAGGEAPAFSPTLGAWVHPSDDGLRLRIASDEVGARMWPTGEEAERAAIEAALAALAAERAAKEAERARAEAALARVAELEAELARRG